ncbi:hypothetical protein [Pyrofollis japonicus]|uniref:hypothetical protein n=1 Tax=Pyrofollis japonicus TaxID=3060460 RepID=UPI00295A9F7C|nr:hypothetical protein [Pyrofollis japonicus]
MSQEARLRRGVVRTVRLRLKFNGREYYAYGVFEENRDYISVEIEKVVPITNGGTGSKPVARAKQLQH